MAYEGSSVTITCVSRTKPKWTKDNVKQFDYLVLNDNTIEIQSVTEEDSGYYKCQGRTREPFQAISELYVGGWNMLYMLYIKAKRVPHIQVSLRSEVLQNAVALTTYD